MTSVSPNPELDSSDSTDIGLQTSSSVDSTRVDSDWSEMRIRLWIAGAFLLLFIVTLLIVAPQIQQRLDRQTMDRLEQAGISSATLEFDWNYRNLTVGGYLPDDVSAAELAVALRGTTEQPSAFFAKGIRNLTLRIDEDVPCLLYTSPSPRDS